MSIRFGSCCTFRQYSLSNRFDHSSMLCRGLPARVLIYRCCFDTTIYTVHWSRLAVDSSLLRSIDQGDHINCGLRIRKKTRSGSYSGHLPKFLNILPWLLVTRLVLGDSNWRRGYSFVISGYNLEFLNVRSKLKAILTIWISREKRKLTKLGTYVKGFNLFHLTTTLPSTSLKCLLLKHFQQTNIEVPKRAKFCFLVRDGN